LLALQAALSEALDRRTKLVKALKCKYTGRSGRYNKTDTHIKQRLESEIKELKHGSLRSLPDDGWMDEESIRALLADLDADSAAATAAATAPSQVRPHPHAITRDFQPHLRLRRSRSHGLPTPDFAAGIFDSISFRSIAQRHRQHLAPPMARAACCRKLWSGGSGCFVTLFKRCNSNPIQR
jgi:hypothetical protein